MSTVTRTQPISTTTKQAESTVLDPRALADLINKYRPIAAAKRAADRAKASKQ